ncbi:CopD family protein [Uliginosibacterium aquaticum]|uniref:Copper resistance protein CopD n=1 Tax=Uliginosibacterium aquaticum TaxID=2731212 RepID=A0ABX2IBH1_9RHOO|nr:copper resistance protein CopD [Uliginosibacterium aquaticum]NSL53661.1 copper resistance protein CopD [Uliginosibacterium aquaticum]
MYRYVLLAHILGACVWTGGHLMLAIAVLPEVMRTRSVERLRQFEGAFERVGLPALLIQLASGLWLAYTFLPEPQQWLNTDLPLSRAILTKLTLLGCTVLVAANARLRIIPRLTPEKLPLMAAHILTVTTLSVLFVLSGVAIRTGWLFY